MKKLVVPFDEKGNQLGYSYYTLNEKEIDEVYQKGRVKYGENYWDECYYEPNRNFYDELKYIGYGRGRSSVKIYFESIISHKRYEMFMKDFDILMQNGKFGSFLKGQFTFCKKGANYGIKMLEEYA